MGRSSFRVGTFNVFNLALPNVPFYRDICYSPEVYRQKTTWIAGQLIRMKADIVGFQEVLQVEALQEAIAESNMYEDATTIAATQTGDRPGVALVSKFPVLDHQVFEAFPDAARLDILGTTMPLDRFSRPVLSVRVALTPALDCTIFVVHLKSKRPIVPEGVDPQDPVQRAKGQARSLILRAAEAIALRILLVDVLRGRNHPIIVMGDVNDSGLAVTTRILSGEQPPWQFELFQKQKIWDVLLHNVKDIQTRRSYGDFYYTHIHNGHYESLDHILVSQEFFPENRRRMGRVEQVSLLNDHLIDEDLSREEVAPWQSDHGQVVATLELK
jgi:exonuclease III